MNAWLLPGPARFVRRVERSLREGVNVVVRFPGIEPAGFREQILSLLQGTLRCTVFRPELTRPPFDCLRDRFAPHLSTSWGPRLLNLCEDQEFQGRLIWIEGVDCLSWEDWLSWRQLLVDYAQVSRSIRAFERTLFVVVLVGTPPYDSPEPEVTLATHDWRDVVCESDLLLLAYERLAQRDVSRAMHSLLATTVARVAAWDLETAERLLEEQQDAILDPIALLRSFAVEKGWTSDTPIRWEVGTASGEGSRHAVLASLDEPPREINWRIWSAQASVMLPVLDQRRLEIAQQHRSQLAVVMEREGMTMDPLDLDIGSLTGMVQRPVFDDSIQRRVRQLNRWRNDLAHVRALSGDAVRSLAGS